MKLKPIPVNTLVHTPTEEEAKELLAILHENGYQWKNGEALNKFTKWNLKENETCYKIYICSMTVTYSDKDWFEKNEEPILTLSDFKRLYCEEEKPQPKFKSDYNVGDIVVITGSFCVNKGNKMTLLRHYDAPREANDYNNVWVGQNATGNTFAIAEKDFEPYTEPETIKKAKENEKTFASTIPTEDMETKTKELNLCELLQGHEGESIFLTTMGEVLVEKVSEEHLFFRLRATEPGWRLNTNGKMSENGVVITFPSRSLYEQYPLDHYTAWMEWRKKQCRYKLDISYTTITDDIADNFTQNLGDIYFRNPADRDKCIEEIKAIIERYSK